VTTARWEGNLANLTIVGVVGLVVQDELVVDEIKRV
jgi:hypothetical protein